MVRSFVYALLAFVFGAVISGGNAGAQVATATEVLTLAKGKQSDYVIVIPRDAIPAERTAASQLQSYLKQVTGAELPVKGEQETPAEARQILVGAGDRVKQLLPGQDWASLKHDGIVIQTVGNQLILAGGRPRGSLYAVFQFLEDSVGCRWWTPSASSIPTKDELTIPPLKLTYVPPFEYREHFTQSVQRDPVFATIMRQNGFHQKQSDDWGGHYFVMGLAHTFGQLLPPEKYFPQHPEWYTDGLNDSLPCTSKSIMPTSAHYQLCMSNPEVLDELTKQALIWFDTVPGSNFISISQEDDQFYCRCPECARVTKEEGTPMGPILKFVNAATERINAVHPDARVETLAYHGTIAAPKTIRPVKNVVIRMAAVDADYGHPIDSEWNQTTMRQLQAWSKIAPELYLWTYAANFARPIFPHPTWTGLGSDLRLYVANNVSGMFVQGDAYSGEAGDFIPLRAWLVGKLMWDPSRDQQALTNEFLKGYYGPAAPHLKGYLDLVQRAFLAQSRGLDIYNADFSFFTPAVARQASELFRKAIEAVQDDPERLTRVRRERVSFDAMALYRYKFLEGQETAVTSRRTFDEALAEFKSEVKQLDVRPFSISEKFDQDIADLLNVRANNSVELPAFAKKLSPGDVVDIQPDGFDLYRPDILTWKVNDPAASNNVAVAAAGSVAQWVYQVQLGRYIDTPDDTWRIYAYARLDPKPGKKPTKSGIVGGIYNVPSRVETKQFDMPYADLVGKTYQRIDLGSHKLNGRLLFWFSSAVNPAIDKVYIDRLLLIREHKPGEKKR